ncbi:MAG: hypothetical protein EPN30_01160 [Actinomycetota bacterium]|nr:MAG: hypothetical protein EPN30_01160 [Actinomycetota bacterium]
MTSESEIGLQNSRPTASGSPPVVAHGGSGTDPTPVALAIFAFALAAYGVRFISVDGATLAAGPTTEALNYAVLAAAIAQAVSGFIAIIRGFAYPGYVTGTLGLWLFGFYMLVTSGAASKEFTPDALAWYVLLAVVPVVILSIPAFMHRNIPFMVAFVAITALLILLGLGYHDLYHALTAAAISKSAPSLSTAVDLVKTSAYFSFIAAIALWWAFAVMLVRATVQPKGSAS